MRADHQLPELALEALVAAVRTRVALASGRALVVLLIADAPRHGRIIDALRAGTMSSDLVSVTPDTPDEAIDRLNLSRDEVLPRVLLAGFVVTEGCVARVLGAAPDLLSGCDMMLRVSGERSLPTTNQPLRSGSALGGRYRLEHAEGAGELGPVWRATGADGATVAVRVLWAHHARDEALRQRFFRGARLGQEVHHPALLPVLDASPPGEDLCWLVMPWMSSDLVKEVRAGRVRGAGGLKALLPVAEALEALHTRGVVHGEVRPGNLFLDMAFRLAPVDLIGPALDRGQITSAGAADHLRYAAPEQFEWGAEVGPQADVFGLAMTMVFVLRGDHPRSWATPAAVLDGVAAPAPLLEVLRAALAEDPRDRTPKPQDLALAVARAGEGPG